MTVDQNLEKDSHISYWLCFLALKNIIAKTDCVLVACTNDLGIVYYKYVLS